MIKVLGLVSLFFLISCNSYRNLDVVYVDKTPFTPTEESITGLWASACEEVYDPTFNISLVRKRLLEVKEDNSFSLTINHYLSSCEEEINLKLVSTGTLEIFPTDIYLREVNFKFKETFLVINNEDRLNFYNENNLCGFSNWAAMQERNVSGLECNRLDGIRSPLNSNTTTYNLFDIKNNELQFGDSSLRNILVEASRPQVLDLASFARVILTN